MRRFLQIMTLVLLLLMSGSVAQFVTVINHIEQTKRVIIASHAVLVTMLNAETGQRGYIITTDAKYLAPYLQAIVALPERLDELSAAMKNYDPEIHSDKIIAFSKEKVAEMDITIKLLQEQGKEAAVAEVSNHIGKNLMDSIRLHVDSLNLDADVRFANYESEGTWYGKIAILTMISSIVSLFLIFK